MSTERRECFSYWDLRARKYKHRAKGFLDDDYFNYHESLRKKAIFSVLEKYQRNRVLDLGCGVGNWSLMFAILGWDVVGIDFSRLLLNMASRRAKKGRTLDFCAMDASALGFRSNTFDLCISITVLQHIIKAQSLKLAVNDLARVTKTNGHIAILEWAPPLRRRTSSSYIISRTRDEWIQVFQKAGFSLVEEKGVSFLAPLLLELYHRIGIRLMNSLWGKGSSRASNSYQSEERLEKLLKNAGISKTYNLGKNLILKLAKPIDYYLSNAHLLKRECDYRVFVFERTS